ncbi:MAG: DUF1659 domain-containing protein, partial [Candidatus Caldatribacteriota bacterium]
PVLEIPQDSRLYLYYVVGTDPETAKPIIKSQSYSAVKHDANNQDVFDVANQMVSLQKYPLDVIRLAKYIELSS